MTAPKTVLAFDFGRKRIGIASGDTVTRQAAPRGAVAVLRSGPDWQAVERAVKLTQDGWQVLYLVNGSAAERAGECAVRLGGHGILLRILSNIGGPIREETPIKLLLVWQPVPVGGSQAGTAVTLIATRPSHAAGNAQRQPLPDFSMSGLAG